MAEPCFGDVWPVLDGVTSALDLDGVGVNVNIDFCNAVFDGVPIILPDLDGVAETAADFTGSLSFVSLSETLCASVLSTILSKLVCRCCKSEPESETEPAKTLLRFLLVLVSGRPAADNEAFGKVFGVEDLS